LKDVNFIANLVKIAIVDLVELENQPLPHYCCFDIDSGDILIDGKIFMISIRESSAI
jgi:hypothetical protein